MAFQRISSSNLADIYGSKVQLPTAQALSGNVLNILNQAIPGFSGLTQTATDIIRNRMAGQLSPETLSNIQRAGAQQAVISGMPGSAALSGSLMGNRTLRDIGATTEQYQQQGFGDLLSMLGGYSGTAALTPAQIAEQANAAAQYAAAPDPATAGQYAEQLYEKRFQEANRPLSTPGSSSDLPWWMPAAAAKSYQVDPVTGRPARYVNGVLTPW